MTLNLIGLIHICVLVLHTSHHCKAFICTGISKKYIFMMRLTGRY